MDSTSDELIEVGLGITQTQDTGVQQGLKSSEFLLPFRGFQVSSEQDFSLPSPLLILFSANSFQLFLISGADSFLFSLGFLLFVLGSLSSGLLTFLPGAPSGFHL